MNARYIARDNNCAQESDYKRTERVIKIDRERGEREINFVRGGKYQLIV